MGVKIESVPLPEVRYDSTGQAFKKVGDDWQHIPELSIDPKTGQKRPDLNSMASNRTQSTQ